MELPNSGESYINPDLPERQRRLGRITLMAVIGPTASGKTTLINRLMERKPGDFHKIVGYTSRPPRSGEIDGVDYHFAEKEQMSEMLNNGEFLQLETLPSGDIYGTTFESYLSSKPNIFTVAAQAMPNFREYGFYSVKPVFVVPDGLSEWNRRILAQGITSAQLPKRLEEAKESFEFALSDGLTKFILNDFIDDAVDRFVQAKDEKEIWLEEIARASAKIIFDQLKLGIVPNLARTIK